MGLGSYMGGKQIPCIQNVQNLISFYITKELFHSIWQSELFSISFCNFLDRVVWIFAPAGVPLSPTDMPYFAVWNINGDPASTKPNANELPSPNRQPSQQHHKRSY